MSAGSDSVAGVLERAADRLSKPGAWTQGVGARDQSGKRVEAWKDGAVCWCAVAAINCETDNKYSLTDQVATFFEKALIPQIKKGFYRPMAQWNDAPERTQAEVVAKLREAAAKARSPQ